VFEGKVMRKIYDPIKNQVVSWRITDVDIDFLIRHADTVRYIKAQGIRRIGNMVRMDKERTVKRVTKWIQITVRRIDNQG
jgi:hypothetical protein